MAEYKVIIDNLVSYTGSGTYFTLFIICLFALYFLKFDKSIKTAFLWYPVFVLAVYFCPAWCLYIKLRDDYAILYRILWLLPIGTVICYVMVELIGRCKGKVKHLAFFAAAVILALSGNYMYDSQYFSRAENPYHVPNSVVEICDAIEVPGREIKVCFPAELIPYVRQYNARICLPYGRSSLFDYGKMYYNPIQILSEAEVIDAKTLSEYLRPYKVAYIVLTKDAEVIGDFRDYDFEYVMSSGDFDVYLDSHRYLGLDYRNPNY